MIPVIALIFAGVHIGWVPPQLNSIATAELVDRIVAVVNDDIISLYELNENLKPYLAKIEDAQYSPDEEAQMRYAVRQRILQQLINQKLADQELERLNINVSEREIDNTIEQIKSSRFLTDEDLREGLAEQGISYEEYRRRIREQLLRSKLVNYEVKSKIVVTRDEVKDYYENHKEDYQGIRKYHLKQIATAFSPLADADEKREVRRQMQDAYQQLESGGSFEDVLERFADRPAFENSGDLGVYELAELSPQLQHTLETMAAGRHTPIIETDVGFQIVYVADIIESGGKSFEEAAAEIRDKIYAERVDRKYHAWLEDLKNRSHIKIVN